MYHSIGFSDCLVCGEPRGDTRLSYEICREGETYAIYMCSECWHDTKHEHPLTDAETSEIIRFAEEITRPSAPREPRRAFCPPVLRGPNRTSFEVADASEIEALKMNDPEIDDPADWWKNGGESPL